MKLWELGEQVMTMEWHGQGKKPKIGPFDAFFLLLYYYKQGHCAEALSREFQTTWGSIHSFWVFTGHTCIGQSRSNPPPNYSQVGIILDCTVQECNRPLARQSTYTPLYFQNQESPCGSAVAIQGAGTTLISTSAICPSGSIVSRRHQRNWCDYGTPS